MKEFKLDNEPKIASGFQIPENYFEKFSNELSSKLPMHQPKVISFWDRNKRMIYGAAAVLVISLTIPLANQLQNNTSLDSVDLENYIANQTSLTNDDIIKLLDEDDIATIEINSSIEDQAIEDVLSQNKNLENYLTD